MRIWLIVLASACFAIATATNLIAGRVLAAVFTGLATGCFVLLAILHGRDTRRARSTGSS